MRTSIMTQTFFAHMIVKGYVNLTLTAWNVGGISCPKMLHLIRFLGVNSKNVCSFNNAAKLIVSFC